MFGSTDPFAEAPGRGHRVRQRPDVFRQAIISPIEAWMPRNSTVPVASTVLMNRPARKSKSTASRVQPCSSARQMNPAQVVGAGNLDVPVDEEVLPRDERVLEHEHSVVLVEPARERIVERAAEASPP